MTSEQLILVFFDTIQIQTSDKIIFVFARPARGSITFHRPVTSKAWAEARRKSLSLILILI